MHSYDVIGSRLYGSLRAAPRAAPQRPEPPARLEEDQASTTPPSRVPLWKTRSEHLNRLMESPRYITQMSSAQGKQFLAEMEKSYREAVRSVGPQPARDFRTQMTLLSEDIVHRRRELPEALEMLKEAVAGLTSATQPERETQNIAPDHGPDLGQFLPHSFYR